MNAHNRKPTSEDLKNFAANIASFLHHPGEGEEYQRRQELDLLIQHAGFATGLFEIMNYYTESLAAGATLEKLQ